MRRLWPFLRRHGATLFGLLLLLGAIWVVQREFRNLSFADVRAAMLAIPLSALWLAGGLTVTAFAVLGLYDWLGARYAGRPSSFGRALFASFCGYTLAHNIGFAAVSGAAVRYRLYSAWGYSPLEIGKIIGFTSLTFGLGGLALGGAVLLFEPEVLPWGLPSWVLQLLGVPMLAVVAAYILLSRLKRSVRLFGHQVDMPGVRLALAQTLLAAGDLAITAGIFFVLLPPAPGLTFLHFVGIYLAAYAAGIAAHVPGGLGVFDGAILLGLSPHLGAAEVVGALLAFRLYYYIVPLFLAGGMFGGFELSQRGDWLSRFGAWARGALALEVPAMTGLVAVMGAVMILLGSLPVDVTALKRWAGYEAALASQFAASVVGSLLLVMAFGLSRRLTIAWAGALLLLLNGAFIAWLRDEAWWTWGGFLLVAALLGTMRLAFYRPSRLRREPLSNEILLPLAAASLCGAALAVIANADEVQGDFWWEVVIGSTAPPQLRFAVGITALLLLVGVVRLLRPAGIAAEPLSPEARARLAALGTPNPESAEAVLWGEAGRAGLAFRRHGRVWVAQGDPVGESRDAISAIWRFRDLCERQGVRPAFLDVGEAYLRVYADTGLQTLADPARPGRFMACDAGRDLGVLREL